MCGIVGAASTRNVVPILIDGIRRLEYRGYDSTGLAVINGGAAPQLERLVSTARVADLARRPTRGTCTATTGISHTRWATHGAPTTGQRASAPVRRRDRGRAQRHHRELRSAARPAARRRATCSARRPTPKSSRISCTRTGTARRQAICCAPCSSAVAEFHGAYAIAVISTREPGRVVGARAGQPAGRRHRRRTITSSPRTRRRCCRSRGASSYLEEGDVADVRRESLRDLRCAGPAASSAAIVDGAGVAATRSSSGRTATSCRRRSSSSRARSPTRSKASQAIDAVAVRRRAPRRSCRQVDSVLILACGTSYYSSLVAKQWIETLARHPVHGRDRERVPLSRQRAATRTRSSSSSRSRARPPTRWRRSSTRSRSATRTRSRSATSRRARWCGRRSSRS